MSPDVPLSAGRMADSNDMHWPLAVGLMLASGFAGLGYQIVWTQQCALWLGHESAAVLAVVAAFFGGLALGSLLLGTRVQRSSRPARWYAVCEAVIAAWSLLLAAGMPTASQWLLTLTGEQPSALWQWSVAFLGTALLLLPATMAMGATLPAMERLLAGWNREGSTLAGLYACNTLGAVLGVLGTAFWLVPELGLVRTSRVCVGLNLGCALLALAFFDGSMPFDNSRVSSRLSPPMVAILALTGLLGIGYEVMVVRVLSQVAQDTVYTFAMLLAVYLVGSAIGAAAYQRWMRSSADMTVWRDRLLRALALACLAGTLSLWNAEALRAWVAQALGDGMLPALLGEAVTGLVAFLLPTIAMGALFSHLSLQARAQGMDFGRSLGINTLGAAAAPFVFGVWMLPAMGAKLVLLIIVAGYLPLSLRGPKTSPFSWALVGAVAALAWWAPPLAFIDVPEGGRVLSYREGAMAAVSVVEDAQGVSRLRIDNRQQEGSSASLLADARQALLPMLLHPSPRRALFLGLGTSVTATSAAEDQQLQVDAVDLLPEVVEASAHFRAAVFGEQPHANLHLMAADARRFVRAGSKTYDLIVSDNFHPARSGSGSLYTLEHFVAVRERLAKDGVFCQWLPLHQLDVSTLRSIVASFLAAYPHGWAMLATNSLQTPVIGLVGRSGRQAFDPIALRSRLSTGALRQPPSHFGIGDEYALLGSFVAGPGSLARFAQGAPLNTDDRPVVAYQAPRITYAPDSAPADRLLAVLGEWRIESEELVSARMDESWRRRLSAYWAARQQFIEAGRHVKPSGDVQFMLNQVREPLLSVLRLSPDFQPAADPLLRMAQALSSRDPVAGRTLRDEVARIQGHR